MALDIRERLTAFFNTTPVIPYRDNIPIEMRIRPISYRDQADHLQRFLDSAAKLGAGKPTEGGDLSQREVAALAGECAMPWRTLRGIANGRVVDFPGTLEDFQPQRFMENTEKVCNWIRKYMPGDMDLQVQVSTQVIPNHTSSWPGFKQAFINVWSAEKDRAEESPASGSAAQRSR